MDSGIHIFVDFNRMLQNGNYILPLCVAPPIHVASANTGVDSPLCCITVMQSVSRIFGALGAELSEDIKHNVVFHISDRWKGEWPFLCRSKVPVLVLL